MTVDMNKVKDLMKEKKPDAILLYLRDFCEEGYFKNLCNDLLDRFAYSEGYPTEELRKDIDDGIWAILRHLKVTKRGDDINEKAC